MTSTRTLYRRKRIQLIKDCIALLTDMLAWEKRDIEAIPMPFFKRLKKFIENRKINKKDL